MTNTVLLREVLQADLPTFFLYQLDPEANAMAAFTAKDPTNRQAFLAHWHRIMTDPSNAIRTIVVDGQVVGSVSSYKDGDHLEVTYWLGKSYWGQGIATQALRAFLAQ